MSAAPTGWPVADLPAVAAAFGHALHATGVPVTPERSARFASSIVLARPTSVDALYWIARVTLVTGPEQLPTFDMVFAHFFRGVIESEAAAASSTQSTPEAAAAERGPQQDPAAPESTGSSAGSSATPGPADEDVDGDESVLAAASVEEILKERDFAACSPDELALIRSLVERLPVMAPLRKGRRSRRHRHGRDLDVRATLRASHRTAGDPIHRRHRRRVDRPRRVVLIADVSGSMEPYARVYLHLLCGAVRATRAEAFVFATRLTRLTRMLRTDHPDVAYARATAAAPDWSGGTRIGEALKVFNDRFGRGGLARGAVVVIVSDGWEVEDPALVGQQMGRLERLAHRVIWVNPRKAAAGYQPLAGGMAAALPHVDTFVSGHSIRALEDVLLAISAR